MPAIYIDKDATTGFQISACVNGNKDVWYKTRQDESFVDKETGAKLYGTKNRTQNDSKRYIIGNFP